MIRFNRQKERSKLKKQKLKPTQKDLIRNFVRNLPEKMRTAIILRFWHGETISSISSYTGDTLEEVQILIQRGLILLKRRLKKHNITDPMMGMS